MARTSVGHEEPMESQALAGPAPALGHMAAPLPADEEERHQALCGLEVLDSKTKADERFDDITKLVSCSLRQVLHSCALVPWGFWEQQSEVEAH